MATTPEGKVKDAIKRTLKARGAYWHMPIQNGMGAPSLDFVGCHDGRYFAIEAKAPGKRPTARQENTMRAIQKGGGAVFVIDSVENHDELINWLERSPKLRP